MLRAMETAAQRFVQRPELCSEEAANKVERASFALTEYLEGVLKGKAASSVALFPQYRAVLELSGGEHAHPADLWAVEWRWLDVPAVPVVDALGYSPGLRGHMDQAVLQVMRSGESKSARRLAQECAGLAAGRSIPSASCLSGPSAPHFSKASRWVCARMMSIPNVQRHAFCGNTHHWPEEMPSISRPFGP